MDYSLENHKSFVGKPISELPTPSLVVNLPVLKKNIDALHQDVEKLGIGFRPHVKTLKTLEVTRLMLAGGKYKGMIASTIPEIKGALPLVEEGLVEECLYGIPVYPGVMPRLIELRKSLRIQLMVDNEQQVSFLEESSSSKQPWDIFIKLDVGSHRAGIELKSESLNRLVERAEKSPAVNIYGFYCHAGHSYGGRSRQEAEETLNVEVSSVLSAARLLPSSRQLVISVGSTPTAHVVESLKASMPDNVHFELHAGNFPCNDLQQVSTGLVTESQQAVTVAAEVCSVYPERNEALVNAGVIALSREASAFSGFGRVVGCPAWGVVRLSQEHGILGTSEGRKVDEEFKVGQKVEIWCNHSCIAAAAFHVYYVVDEEGIVRDTWIPWKGCVDLEPHTSSANCGSFANAHHFMICQFFRIIHPQLLESTLNSPPLHYPASITMSYADIAAKGPKQSPEDAAAPQPPQIISDESASTASLVDVDMPSVHTVPADFLEQEIQTETQAARIEREEEAHEEEKKRKRDSATAKAKQTDNWLIQQFSKLSDGNATGLVIANFATVVGLSAYLGYKGWGLYEKGKLDWKAVGLGAGILASVTAAEGAVGRYLYKGKKGGS
ncbi:putative serine dehydratase domain-containing protein [Fusarium flagelliforme]|uniref:putative serine dehydratase domain-containing protein n=1 Tax=Fusarium flagelliforme TaxID=2675880 RepID=UPI001E8E7601|nr:putative serine dehydratase domain-containing protein [Fusarium flagelliforme]KAH7192730.1 putative serine dehydratase domain-containing protein [Fusarium flagelliforme]